MSLPLVSVVCLCYNHAEFVRDAVLSVLAQSYPNIEIIVVDDASNDGSQQVIAQIKEEYPQISVIFNAENLGNCKSFNKGFKLSKGAYIVDLATDDILLPERIALGVADLEKLGDAYGVNYCDAWLVNPDRSKIKTHYKRNADGVLQETVPHGNIYREVLKRYFISTPTMLIRRQVLEDAGGYNETLAYEDFDFWVNSSRFYHYSFMDKILVEKRIIPGSLSSKQFKKGSQHDLSTLRVCQAAYHLNIDRSDHLALMSRAFYEFRKSLLRADFALARDYGELWWKTAKAAISSGDYHHPRAY